MAYTNFTLQEIRNKFNIKEIRVELFDNIEAIPISDWLKETLAMTKKIPMRSEKAKSELIVTPILVELRRRNDNFFTFFSGEALNVDSELGLSGECDFILTKDDARYGIDAPIISLVQAKKNDLELGVVQCAAQMIGAAQFNKNNNNPIDVIYGCVTTAEVWNFMKLEGNELLIDENLYYFTEIEMVIGAFQKIIDYYKHTLSEMTVV